MPTYVSPYTVTVTSTAGGMSHCSYVDGNGLTVPPGTVLTTSTPKGQPGELGFIFKEATVDARTLRLVGAAVKTVGNDPTMNPYNYLPATRTESDGGWTDGVVVPWSADAYTMRGVVLLFAQVNDHGDMVNFFPSSDPQTQNDQPPAC
ncbi:MAG: hypothetical protein IIA03_04660 [Proteobacteria bacterium]|jgi:hypothetical protein|nr:hypothetical protein [Methylibium sp.]MBY0366850.1 hypothetical protein [Burkholderiaceae bacterium]MCH8855530.1 hypothetical protein [Pseudomonadota bacterium]|mmetsp:Transcript_57680/g.135858  ORF Transcript_57680/g.135858 Transcript_57680/m.135858 type:complete len:148 (+) Transcript_57680:1455-1898(+)